MDLAYSPTVTVRISYLPQEDALPPYTSFTVEVPYQSQGGGRWPVPKWVTDAWAERKASEHAGHKISRVDVEVLG